MKYFRKRPDLTLFATRNTPESILGFELVTYAPDCFKFPFIGNTLQLFTKTLDMNVNGS
jgi:hypothetical protein